MQTVNEEQAKYRVPIPIDHSSEGGHRERVAAGQEENRLRNLARQSGQPFEDEKPAPVSPEIEARRIVHDLGLSNQAESRRFVLRILLLEQRAAALETEIVDLKRRKGLPLKTETR